MTRSEDSHIWAETIPIPSIQVLGRAISRRRHSLRLSQRTVRGKAGVAPSVISRLELEGDESTPFGVVLRVVEALELDLELWPRGPKFTPRPPTKLNELGLSPGTMSALRKEGLEDVDQLGSASPMLARAEFCSGVALYEIVCAFNRYGLSLPTSGARRVRGDREREIFRLRVVDVLRAYPVWVVARWAFLKAMRPLASWSSARWFSSFLDQRMRIARLRFIQE